MTLTDLLAGIERAETDLAAAREAFGAKPCGDRSDAMERADSHLRLWERAARPVLLAAMRELAASRRMLTEHATPIIVYSGVDVLDRGVVERYTAARSATDVALDLVEVSR
jgi:hypothetical protein